MQEGGCVCWSSKAAGAQKRTHVIPALLTRHSTLLGSREQQGRREVGRGSVSQR